MHSLSTWRLLDTGHRTAAENMALDRTLLEARASGRCPNTLRFLQFVRPAVLVGYHQRLDQEVRLDFCQREGIEINRRITGGGAVLFEPSHIGWEVIAHREDPLFFGISPPEVVQRICEVFCAALKEEFGLPAEFRPRNDIEVRGRKISGTGGTEEGGAFLFQGTLLVDLDVWTMLRALRVPMEKLKAHEVDSLLERVTTLRRELGWTPPAQRIKEAVARAFSRSFSMELSPDGLTPWEGSRLKELNEEFRSPRWIDRRAAGTQRRRFLKAVHRGEGGLIHLLMDADTARRRIRSVVFTGDFFAYPGRALYDLESRFKDTPAKLTAIEPVLRDFFRGGSPFPSLGPEDFLQAFRKAIQKMDYLELGFTHEETHAIFPVGADLHDLLRMPWRWFLLPYCSKDLSCELRHQDGCWECGACTIGEGYSLAREHGMKPVTITSFEDLMDRLRAIRREGGGGYLGCCCEGFYIKHARDFEEAGIPGILVAMDSTTCYDLGKVREAYAGRFENQTEINLPLLRKVLQIHREGKVA